MKNNIKVDKYYDFFGQKVLFIFPSKILGGHELMSLEIIEDLLSLNIQVDILCDPSNIDLINNLSLNNRDFYLLSFSQPHFEIINTVFNVKNKLKVKKFFSDFNLKGYCNIILCQGDIEIGSSIVSYFYNKNIEFISYIPYAHSAQIMSKKLACFRDFISLFFYKKIMKYITINNEASKKIKKLNNAAQVFIIENKVRNLDEYKFKRNLYFTSKKNDNKKKIYIIGRIFFRQKGQDLLVEALSKANIDHRNITLNIIGSGPDEDELRMMVRRMCPNLDVIFHGWKKEPWVVAYDADYLIIPSRFEGVPLIMLEALELGINILASNRDGMKDYISKSCLFNNLDEFILLLENEV